MDVFTDSNFLLGAATAAAVCTSFFLFKGNGKEGGSAGGAGAGGKIKLYYFPAAGRAETIRLIARAGGLPLEECGGEVKDKAGFGSPGSVPVLQHGDLKMAQSTAIENYLSLLAFPDLSAQDRARDAMFLSIKEDILAGCAKVIFGDKTKAPEEVPKVLDKWYPVVEGLLPSSGFINGGDGPTSADLAVLTIVQAYMPFGSALKHGKIVEEELWKRFPKMKALADLTAQSKGVKQYLAEADCCMGKTVFGL